MGKLAQIRHVKGAFSADIARAAIEQNTRRVTTHVALVLVALTDGAGVVELTTEQACARTGWRVGAVRRAFKELEELGAIQRDDKVSWRFRWNAERLTALSAEHSAANERQVCETYERSAFLDGRGSAILAALRDGYKREHARQTKNEGVVVNIAPPAPPAHVARELVGMVDQLAAELERDECEVARYLAQAYRRFDKGAEASCWSWAWLLRSTVAPMQAARLIKAAELKSAARQRSTPPPAPTPDRSAAAAAAAAVARAAGGAR